MDMLEPEPGQRSPGGGMRRRSSLDHKHDEDFNLDDIDEDLGFHPMSSQGAMDTSGQLDPHAHAFEPAEQHR